MQRDLEEVLASQQTMLRRLGRKTSSLSPEELRGAFEQQIRRAKQWLQRRGVPTLFVEYGAAIDDAQSTATALNAFLGGQLDVPAMAGAVSRSLYRQRRANADDESACFRTLGAGR